jgi:D-erythronate 2-dehydrogenase
MRILVIGAGGMLGAKLVAQLVRDGAISGRVISHLIRADAVQCAPVAADFSVETVVCDLSVQGTAAQLMAGKPELIFQLAAVVSGEAERDFDKGYRINLDATRYLLEAAREAGHCPKIIFTSSIAVFGAPFPEAIADDYFTTPLTSYGTQKAIAELLLSDYSRRGFVDGVALRMPTVCVRPGTPNLAASGFFSNIIREPLVGLPAVLPVDDSTRHWFASPRAAVGFLIRAAEMDLGLLGARRALTLPGLSCTVAEQIEALGRVAGSSTVALISRINDPLIAQIVAGWPQRFDARRAKALGFSAEDGFDAIIRSHIQDELGG